MLQYRRLPKRDAGMTKVALQVAQTMSAVIVGLRVIEDYTSRIWDSNVGSVQDPAPRPVTTTTFRLPAGSGGCANGACAAPATYYYRPAAPARGGLFRWR